MLNFQVTVAPTIEPVDLEEVQRHLRIDDPDDAPQLNFLIGAARAQVEEYLGRALLTQTIVYRLDCFPSRAIRLPRAPLQSVSSIEYVDGDGATQTLSSSLYQVDSSSEPARVLPVYGGYWPVTRPTMNAVTITYVAGWTAASAVPAPIRQAILMRIHDLKMNGGDVARGSVAQLPNASKHLLSPYRMHFTP